MIVEEIAHRTRMGEGRDHPRTWDLLRLTRMPAVRIRCGNLAYPDDSRLLADSAFVDSLAQAITDAVVRFYSP
jgi:N-acetylmuramoyl-L-alanine amidase